jgi:YebC/PmpR family DNA-binding regulatory protein
VKRGTGELEGVSYEEVTYEGYGPGGVALFIETLTDNQKRTVAAIRHILDKHGGNLGTSGSVAWQFDRKGQIYVDAGRYHEEAVFEAAIEAGAEDVGQEGEEFTVTTDPATFQEVQDEMKSAGVEFSQAELTFIARNEVSVTGKDAEKLLRILDALEENDDVQKVHSNADIDEDILARAE